MRGVRSLSKLLIRATEISHLRYSTSELLSIGMAITRRRKSHNTELLGFKVRYLDAASFRLVAFEVFVKGEYFFEASNDSPVILDCGANIGLATLFFKRLYPRARLHSFEADPATSEILRFNVEQNHLEDVTVSNILLTDHGGSEKFYVASETPGSLMMSSTPSRFATDRREITVNAGRLSEYIDGRIDLLKLDVEGSEFGVMQELVSSGKIAHIAKMIIEYHHRIGNESSRLGSFLGLLEDAGFEYYIDARFNRMSEESSFQDILIGASRE